MENLKRIDVANGDADGLFALHQLRLAEGVEGELVTGAKRDVKLLERVRAGPGDLVTVCDISLAANRDALLRLLGAGARVRYFDHHHAGDVPDHASLEAHLDASAGTCTSLLVDRHLGGAQRAWAVAAAFGDSLDAVAREHAAPLDLPAGGLESLRELGGLVNYNAYGESVAELLVAPAELYRLIAPFRDPLECLSGLEIFKGIASTREADLENARKVSPRLRLGHCAAYVLPEAAWSRRVIGEFANRLEAEAPERALAVLAPSAHGGFIVSVRAPRGGARDAGAFCSRFADGGGRRQAGGINRLPAAQSAEFLRAFEKFSER